MIRKLPETAQLLMAKIWENCLWWHGACPEEGRRSVVSQVLWAPQPKPGFEWGIGKSCCCSLLRKHTHTHTRTHTHECLCVYIYMYSRYLYIYIFISICIYIYLYMSVYGCFGTTEFFSLPSAAPFGNMALVVIWECLNQPVIPHQRLFSSFWLLLPVLFGFLGTVFSARDKI